MNPPRMGFGIDERTLRDKIHKIGLPQPRKDPWKYTSPTLVLGALESQSERVLEPKSVQTHGVILTNWQTSRVQELLSSHTENLISHSKNPLVLLNLLYATHGYVVQTDPSAERQQVVHIEPARGCERVFVVVEPNTTLELIENNKGGNRVIECVLKNGATLLHRRFQQPTDEVEFNQLSVTVQDNASYSMTQYTTGARLRRQEIEINIDGEHATVSLSGAWRLTGKTHGDLQLTVNHNVESSESKQRFNGVASDQSRAVFNGRIYIARGAQKTDAHLHNRNLLTDIGAETHTKPELEIYADDVSCSHGVTCGQIDQDQVRYMRSRGIPEDVCRTLLTDAFLNEIVEHPTGAKLLHVPYSGNSFISSS